MSVIGVWEWVRWCLCAYECVRSVHTFVCVLEEEVRGLAIDKSFWR